MSPYLPLPLCIIRSLAGLVFSLAAFAASGSEGAPEASAELAPASGIAVAGAAAHSAHTLAAQQPARAGIRPGPGHGALFRISRDGEMAYLFGTIHVGATSFYPLAPQVSQALAEATQLVLELDTRADAAFDQAVARHASYAGGDHIRHHVSADTLRRLVKALHAVGIPLSDVGHLKPWLLANMLTGIALEKNGFQRAHGNESFLLDAVQARGARLAELESADYQLSLFDTLDEDRAESYLREALDDLSSGSAMKKARAVIDAWTSGDADALEALIPDTIGAGTVTSDFTLRTLLDRRNPEMAQRIAHIMKDGKVSFVGVGLLHLLGANGLPRLLAQRGYRVERVVQASAPKDAGFRPR
ncbi:TraB/GumN family protein [Massilia soli]|uniref:TraB/GumN family protein n=1 Tax=Massilia soli TaxID=2792854 RepID=A0ABS7SNB8_9BURK|nr:TraB/GumN family protein [Massilia soli]MBZ2206640.1 TraB/GumN family protein [Massilia soli]